MITKFLLLLGIIIALYIPISIAYLVSYHRDGDGTNGMLFAYSVYMGVFANVILNAIIK